MESDEGEKQRKNKRNKIASIILRNAKKEVLYKENKLKRKLTKEERQDVIRSTTKKLGTRVAIFAGTLALSFGGGYLLNTGSGKIEGVNKTEKGIEIDTAELEGNVDILLKREQGGFKERYKVSDNGDIAMEKGVSINPIQIFEQVEKEIDELDSTLDVWDYMENIYEQAYLKEHGEPVKVVHIFKEAKDFGKSVIRIFGNKVGEEKSKELERVIRSESEVKNAENEGEVLLKNNKDVYSILAVGCEYAKALESEYVQRSSAEKKYLRSMKDSWNKSLKEYVIKLKESQMNQNSQEKKTDGYEH